MVIDYTSSSKIGMVNQTQLAKAKCPIISSFESIEIFATEHNGQHHGTRLEFILKSMILCDLKSSGFSICSMKITDKIITAAAVINPTHNFAKLVPAFVPE